MTIRVNPPLFVALVREGQSAVPGPLLGLLRQSLSLERYHGQAERDMSAISAKGIVRPQLEGFCARTRVEARLLVEPYVLPAVAVEDAVDH